MPKNSAIDEFLKLFSVITEARVSSQTLLEKMAEEEKEKEKEVSYLDALLETIEEEEEANKLTKQDTAILKLTDEVDRIARGLQSAEMSLESRIAGMSKMLSRLLEDDTSMLKAEIIKLSGQIADLKDEVAMISDMLDKKE